MDQMYFLLGSYQWEKEGAAGRTEKREQSKRKPSRERHIQREKLHCNHVGIARKNRSSVTFSEMGICLPGNTIIECWMIALCAVSMPNCRSVSFVAWFCKLITNISYLRHICSFQLEKDCGGCGCVLQDLSTPPPPIFRNTALVSLATEVLKADSLLLNHPAASPKVTALEAALV